MSDTMATADVYAGDILATGTPETPNAVFRFDIDCDIAPDVFGRVANILNLANVAPLYGTIERRFDALRLSIALSDIAEATVRAIHRNLDRLTTVRTVSVTRNVGPDPSVTNASK